MAICTDVHQMYTNRSRSSRSSWNCSSCSLHSKMISRCLLFDNDYVEVIEFILSHFYSFRINTLHQSFIITFKQQLLPQHSSNNAGGRTFYSAKEPSPRNFPIFNLHFENWRRKNSWQRLSITSPLPRKSIFVLKANNGFRSLLKNFLCSESKLLNCSDSQIGSSKPILSNWGFCKVHNQCLAMQIYASVIQIRPEQCKIMQSHAHRNNAIHCCTKLVVQQGFELVRSYNVSLPSQGPQPLFW